MLRIVSLLKKHQSGWPFLVPVEDSIAPGYSEIIKNPMDLGTVEAKLK
jgi:hypothetical protein